jgi:hypothetical protein
VKTLNVDFAPRRPVPAWLWGTVMAACLALAAQQGWTGWTLRRQALSAETQAAQLAAKLDAALQSWARALGTDKPEAAYSRDADAIVRLAAFPIADILASIESAQVQGVKVTALEVSAAERTARAELEYDDQEALMRYMDRINADQAKRKWLLAQARAGIAGPRAALPPPPEGVKEVWERPGTSLRGASGTASVVWRAE